MPQIPFAQNCKLVPANVRVISANTIYFVPFNIEDSISFNTLNVLLSVGGTNSQQSITFNFGLYSLTGSTLSITNSISVTDSVGSFLNQNPEKYLSFTATSATQNITPGTWYFGIRLSTSGGTSRISLYGGVINNPGNVFQGSFIGGRMTVSSSVLPASVATSDLDVTGLDAMFVPYILISA